MSALQKSLNEPRYEINPLSSFPESTTHAPWQEKRPKYQRATQYGLNNVYTHEIKRKKYHNTCSSDSRGIASKLTAQYCFWPVIPVVHTSHMPSRNPSSVVYSTFFFFFFFERELGRIYSVDASFSQHTHYISDQHETLHRMSRGMQLHACTELGKKKNHHGREPVSRNGHPKTLMPDLTIRISWRTSPIHTVIGVLESSNPAA